LQNRLTKALEDLNQGTKQLKSRYLSMLEENEKMLKEVTELQDRLQEAVNMRTSLEEHRYSEIM
jgi:regulator of replication initiation timing